MGTRVSAPPSLFQSYTSSAHFRLLIVLFSFLLAVHALIQFALQFHPRLPYRRLAELLILLNRLSRPISANLALFGCRSGDWVDVEVVLVYFASIATLIGEKYFSNFVGLIFWIGDKIS